MFKKSYVLEVQCIPFNMQPNNHVLRYKNQISISSEFRRDTQLKVTVVDRPVLTPVAEKLWTCEHGVFASRMCFHSRTLLAVIGYCWL
jgi:hypothetical protein